MFNIFGQMLGQGAVRTVEQNPRLPLDQQAQLRKFVLENGDARQYSVHKIPFLNAAVDRSVQIWAASLGEECGVIFKVSKSRVSSSKVQAPQSLIAHGSLLTAYPALAAYDRPESCTACLATTFISFSSDEKRCMTS